MKIYRDILFVYGTLMRGFDNPYAQMLHQHGGFLGRGYFSGRLYSRGAYPTAIYDADCPAFVYGELFELGDLRILEALDTYEGIGPEAEAHVAEYRRICIRAFKEDGAPLFCWAYVDNAGVEGLRCLPSGDYRDYA